MSRTVEDRIIHSFGDVLNLDQLWNQVSKLTKLTNEKDTLQGSVQAILRLGRVPLQFIKELYIETYDTLGNFRNLDQQQCALFLNAVIIREKELGLNK